VLAAFRTMGGAPCVLERFVDLACEISVIVARSSRGDTVTWPVAENRHRDGILDVSVVPARVSPRIADEARAIATAIAEKLRYRGVLCVEMFVTREGALTVNEIAPRPHNSGHYTIDACVTSQFEQQVRVLAGLPLGEVRQHECAVMVNLLGDVWYAGPGASRPREPDWARVLAHGAAKLHLYGKTDARRGRKMGHVTCVAPTLDDALASARAIRRELGIPDADAL
jgi:5-(carboxyamino)imidazole ribonucleotide synthase